MGTEKISLPLKFIVGVGVHNNHMKTFIACMTFILMSNPSMKVQEDAMEKIRVEKAEEVEIKKMLKEFYAEYITKFLELPVEEIQRRLELLQKKHCTQNFLNKIPMIVEQTWADPILKAQDTDLRYIETLKVTKAQEPNEYVVSYIADGALYEKDTVTIRIIVVKEGENYKIDSVE